MNSLSELIIFADNISDIISNTNSEDFCTMSNLVLPHVTEWLGPKSR